MFGIARRVAPDRIISTVDVEARHGHKSHDRKFDGYKTHLSIDPDSELIDEVTVTAANAADHDAVDDLLAPVADAADKPIVFGDSAYADGATLARLEGQGFEVIARVPAAHGRDDQLSKDSFAIDLEAGTVTCPAGAVAAIRWAGDGGGVAGFDQRARLARWPGNAPPTSTGAASPSIPTSRSSKPTRPTSKPPSGSRHTPAPVPRWNARSVTSWPRSGVVARRAPGHHRVATDADTRAAAVNWSRLDILGVRWNGAAWAATGP